MTTPDKDGWIECGGGECPIPDAAHHEVKFRDGSVFYDTTPKSWNWNHIGAPWDITAYRLINPPVSDADLLKQAIEALRPFGIEINSDCSDDAVWDYANSNITAGDFRKARAVLALYDKRAK